MSIEQERFYAVDPSGELIESWAGPRGCHYKAYPRAGYDSGVPASALMAEAIMLLIVHPAQFVWPHGALELIQPSTTQQQIAGCLPKPAP